MVMFVYMYGKMCVYMRLSTPGGRKSTLDIFLTFYAGTGT